MANEKRLIDANALIDWLTKPTGFIRNCDDCPDIDCLHCVIEDAIKTAPTVDAVEVVPGRWFAHHSHLYECTCCHAKYITMRAKDWNYCPNCGADMRGDGNG